MDHTRKVAQAVPTNRLLFYSNSIEQNDLWPLSSFQKFVQSGEDLGARIEHAFHRAFQQYKKVLIIGSDCPTLTPEIVQNAYDQLDQHSFVIGPANDGGYYLLGMKEYTPSLFQGVTWSTPEVFPTTIQKIKTLGKTYALLPVLSDVDYEEDWDKYGWEIGRLSSASINNKKE